MGNYSIKEKERTISHYDATHAQTPHPQAVTKWADHKNTAALKTGTVLLQFSVEHRQLRHIFSTMKGCRSASLSESLLLGSSIRTFSRRSRNCVTLRTWRSSRRTRPSNSVSRSRVTWMFRITVVLSCGE